MPREKLIFEPVLLDIPVNYPELTDPIDSQASEGARIRAFFSDIVDLDPAFPLILSGRAHGVLPGSSAVGDSRSLCNLGTDGGCEGRIVLAPLAPGNRSLRITLEFWLIKGQGDQGWLRLSFNPTTIIARDNVHPASLPDPDTGEIVGWPSSSLTVVGLFFRLGYFLVESLFRQMTGSKQPLFEPATWARIQAGAVKILHTQNCAYLPSPNVSEDLKGLSVLFGQTIVTGKGIINLAKLQGLEFDGPYVDPRTHEVETVLVIKTQGKRPTISTEFYNKDARSRETRQRKSLSDSKAATVGENVRLDITLHSLGVKAVVRRARMRLEELIKKDPGLMTRVSPEEFLSGEPQSTVWALEQAIWLLSVEPQKGKIVRRSFADWLVPYVLKDLLRLDVITEFTVEGYEKFLKLKDKIAVAWRKAGPADVNRWAEALAKKANVTVQTVYNRQAAWRKKYGIAIDLPNAFYRDALYFGANSVSKPKDRAATLAAQSRRDGNALLRLRDEAALDFDRLRAGVGAMIRAPLHLMPVEVGLINPMAPVIGPTAASASGIALASPPANVDQAGGERPAPADAFCTPGRPGTGTDLDPALVRRPRAMELKLPPLASPAPEEFDDLPADFDDVDGDEAVPTRPASARPMAKESMKKVRLRGMYSPPPPPPQKTVVLRGFYSPPPPPPVKKLVLGASRSAPRTATEKKVVFRASLSPPPTGKKLVLPAMPSPPPPSTGSNVVLRAAHRPLPSPTEKKVVPRAMPSPPPPAPAVRISVDATIRRQASEQYFDYRSSVRRALLASKSWTRTGINNSKGSRR